jgi:hydroxyacylglutathione hydrolase
VKEVAPGITILKRYGPYKNACWLLQAGSEAAVVEMPMFSSSERPPYQRVESTVRRRHVHLKYALLSHGHIDHCLTLPSFRRWFPHTKFVAHRSMVEDRHFVHLMSRSPDMPWQDWMEGRYRLFDELFGGVLWTGSLGGEPIHMIYAPKHSYTDHLILFRGAMITGDWFLGDLRDCNAIVSPQHKRIAIERAAEVVRELGYHVHMMFSAHGDCLFYDVDFYAMMRKSLIAH